MAVNIYVVPQIGIGTIDDPYRPKYFGSGEIYSSYSPPSLRYGVEPTYLVKVNDILPADNTTLSGLPDVISVPDLQQTVGAQVTTVQNRLEALNIPGQWVTSGMSYGSVCRYVAVFFLLMQVLTERLGKPRLYGGAITLSTAWNTLPQSVKNDLKALATELNFDSSGMTGNTTIRQIFKALADQWSSLTISLGNTTL